MITNNNIRDYEISVWTLQDGFITVLKPTGTENKGTVQNPKITLKNDGTQTISFSIPMYYTTEGRCELNPNWYSVQNGAILVNMRKIKLIFNKRPSITDLEEGEENLEKVFEFLITKVTERHNNNELICDIEGEGLAFHELGRIGYKISLSQDDYLNEWEKDASLINNIDYWMLKIMTFIPAWKYRLEMSWITEYGAETLTSDKIYEESYISSWTVENGQLIPGSVQETQEKLRLIDVEESNIYNITQTIAENFGVFCRYEYTYDSNYHIVDRYIIFYNNFFQEVNNMNLDLNYGYDSSAISREMDSTDLVSKMYVKSLDDDNSEAGIITIADIHANPSLEDYVLNFDYLYKIGTITKDQYAAISEYEATMRGFNEELIPIETNIIGWQTKLVDLEAKRTVASNSMQLDEERITAAQKAQAALPDAITDDGEENDGLIHVTENHPAMSYIIKESDGISGCILIHEKGIVPDTIKLYYNYNSVPHEGEEKLTDEIINFIKIFDENGNLIKISGFSYVAATPIYYTYSYNPQLYYSNIIRTWSIKYANDKKEWQDLDNKIDQINQNIYTLQNQYNEKLADKNEAIGKFNSLMGSALREGTWQPEDEYQNYGEYRQVSLQLGETSTDGYATYIYDTELFDDEQDLTYKIRIQGDEVSYHYVELNNAAISEIIQRNGQLEKMCFIFQKKNELNAVLNGYYYFPLNSQCCFAFLKSGNTVKKILLLTGAKDFEEFGSNTYGNFQIGTVQIDSSNVNNVNFEIDTWYSNLNVSTKNQNEQICYPRIKINSAYLKTGENELVLTGIDNNSSSIDLLKYEDYYLLSRIDQYEVVDNNETITKFETNYYITIKPYKFFKYNLSNRIDLQYIISNASAAIYLDAVQILKENSVPKVSYSVTPALINPNFVQKAYLTLNQIVHINDPDLKFEYVRGYISELNLDLDFPQNDNITVNNYKNKFEDLFSTIVAQTEEMKKSSAFISAAANVFTVAGELKCDVVQNVLHNVDLDYAFNNGTLTIDETNGIWGTSEDGVVAFRGGGIFTATRKDSAGNWEWNTGILPSGINASLITTGQLDTNLINVYAGDDLKFQLNGDGLFAYRSWWDNNNENYAHKNYTTSINEQEVTQRPDGLDFGQYVVHNSEGLFLIAEAGTAYRNPEAEEGEEDYYITLENDIERVAISWDGLTLRNWENKPTFLADADTGDLYISGNFMAGNTIETLKEKNPGIDIDLTTNTREPAGMKLTADGFWLAIHNDPVYNLIKMTEEGILIKNTIDQAPTPINNEITLNSDGIKIGVNTEESEAQFKLDKDGGAMQNLSVANLVAPNVAKQYNGTAIVHIISNSTPPNDGNDYYNTIEEFNPKIENCILGYNLTVKIHNQDNYGINFNGISGTGDISIEGDNVNSFVQINGNTTFRNVHVNIEFKNIEFVGQVSINNSQTIHFNNCKLQPAGGVSSEDHFALALYNGSIANVTDCELVNNVNVSDKALIYAIYSLICTTNIRGGNANIPAFALTQSIALFNVDPNHPTRPNSIPDTFVTGQSYLMVPDVETILTYDLNQGSDSGTVPANTSSDYCTLNETGTRNNNQPYGNTTRIRQGIMDDGNSLHPNLQGYMKFTGVPLPINRKAATLVLTRISGFGRSSAVEVQIYCENRLVGSTSMLGGETKNIALNLENLPGGTLTFELRTNDTSLYENRQYSKNYAHFYGKNEKKPPELLITT